MNLKVIPRAEAAGLGERLRRQGQRIIFANGCFDLLHVGHARYLEAARRLGDALVVGINGDDSARKLKGRGRPLLSAAARAELVAALGAVTYVVIFDELTAEGLLRDLRPHIHCKGTDYSKESVPERGVLNSWGGEIVIAGDAKSHSTSDLIARIAAAESR